MGWKRSQIKSLLEKLSCVVPELFHARFFVGFGILSANVGNKLGQSRRAILLQQAIDMVFVVHGWEGSEARVHVGLTRAKQDSGATLGGLTLLDPRTVAA